MTSNEMKRELLKSRLNRAKFEAEKARIEKITAKFVMDSAQIELAIRSKQAEEIFEGGLQGKVANQLTRPCHLLDTEIEYDTDQEQWACHYQGVVAYGDTPELACENFDHKWMFSE